MMKWFFLVGCCLPLLLSAAPDGVVNVLDYLKKQPDNASAALQQAAHDANKTGRALFIPGGRTYRLTETVNIGSVREIRGIGEPLLVMTDPDKDIFTSQFCWRTRMEGLSFEGGRNQLSLSNRNLDRAQIVIANCRFAKANGAAVRFSDTTVSTLTIIENCSFDFCTQVLVTYSDHCRMSNCWIQTNPKNPKNLAVIENWNYLAADNIVGVPLMGGNDLRWIDNHGATLSCRNFRFGGEGGGFVPVVNHRKYRKEGYGVHILIEDSLVCAVGNPLRASAIYCEELPNSITIRNCRIFGVPPVKLSPKLDVKNYFSEAKPGMIRCDIANNTGEFSAELPSGLLDAVKAAAQNKVLLPGQLNDQETRTALSEAVAENKKIASPPRPGVVRDRKGTVLYTQQTHPDMFKSITAANSRWILSDRLDGLTDRCNDYLALAEDKENVIVMARIDRPSYPHVRIELPEIDLDAFPILSWNLKQTAAKGGHIAVKIVDRATGKQSELMEDYQNSQFRYCAFDLRKVLGKSSGKAALDIKFYLCGCRITNQGAVGKNGVIHMKKGEYFVLDFMRLERAQTTKVKK